MIDLTKAKLPETIEVDGSVYRIQTSFKYWLSFKKLLEDTSTPPQNFDFMYIDEKPASRMHGLLALVKFSNPPAVLPRIDRHGSAGIATDYDIDADYIYAAFMEQYGIDLVTSELHWYKFTALFHGLHDTKLNEIIGYRLWENTEGRHDSYTRHMEDLRRAWELPQNSDENDEDLKAFEAKLYPKSQK